MKTNKYSFNKIECNTYKYLCFKMTKEKMLFPIYTSFVRKKEERKSPFSFPNKRRKKLNVLDENEQLHHMCFHLSKIKKNK